MFISSYPHDAETIFQLHPYTLQQNKINCLHNWNYPSIKFGKIWNKGFVDTVLDIPPKENIKGSDVREARRPGCWSIIANPSQEYVYSKAP